MGDADSEKPKFGGMTVNERLAVAGLVDEFDAAARARDRVRMIALLTRVDVDDPDCSVDVVLKDSGKYGY